MRTIFIDPSLNEADSIASCCVCELSRMLLASPPGVFSCPLTLHERQFRKEQVAGFMSHIRVVADVSLWEINAWKM